MNSRPATLSSASSAMRRRVLLAAFASCSLAFGACSSDPAPSGGSAGSTTGSGGGASTGSMGGPSSGGSGALPAGSGGSSGLASGSSGGGGSGGLSSGSPGSGSSGGLSSGSVDSDAGAPDGTAVPSPDPGARDAAVDGGSVVGDGGQDLYPLLKVLPLFTAANVPARGPMESPPTPRNWTAPATLPARTGNGIAQHPMLYVGENYDRISLVNGGKVVWTYDTAPGYELDDVWMLSNGNILYSHMTFVEEITPQKQVVWHYVPTNGEVHSVQPIGLDKVLFFENAVPMGRVRIYNKKTSTFEVDHMVAVGVPPGKTLSQHGEVRRIRMTRAGTYLIGFMDWGRIVEFDSAFNILWTYMTPRPWSAVRLKNGNTLIQDETLSATLEVNPQSQIVWQLAKTDFTLPAGTGMGNTQSGERLSSGNTVMFGNGGTNVNNIQAVEVTPAKQVVWMLQDWTHLGDATSAQFLDEPGYPEIPGDTNH